jgi:tetratricopeptide (TPR) repeat protein
MVPTDGRFWNALGVAQYRASQWEKAIDSLQKSTAMRKDGDVNEWFFLAMSHWQLGHKDEARKWFDKAVEWTDKNQSKDEVLIGFRTEAAELLGVSMRLPATESMQQDSERPDADESTSPATTDNEQRIIDK